MDFSDTPQEAEFRAEVRAFLDANAEPISESNTTLSFDSVAEHVDSAKAWQKKKYDAGLAAITWPEAFGDARYRRCSKSFTNRKRKSTGPARRFRNRTRDVYPNPDETRGP